MPRAELVQRWKDIGRRSRSIVGLPGKLTRKWPEEPLLILLGSRRVRA